MEPSPTGAAARSGSTCRRRPGGRWPAGAILKFGVTATVSGLDVATIGIVLMVVGVIGLALGLVLMTRRRRTDVIHTDATPHRTVRQSTTYTDPADPMR